MNLETYLHLYLNPAHYKQVDIEHKMSISCDSDVVTDAIWTTNRAQRKAAHVAGSVCSEFAYHHRTAP
jgi:hypothetical protein